RRRWMATASRRTTPGRPGGRSPTSGAPARAGPPAGVPTTGVRGVPTAHIAGGDMRAALVRRALVALAVGTLAAGCSPTTAAREEAVATVHARPREADGCFVEMMVPHHQQAVDMSEILLAKDGVWERGQRFAQYVAATQAQEIQAMEAWLEAWDGALAGAAEQLNAGGSGPRTLVPATPEESGGGGGHAGHAAPAAGDEVALPSCSHSSGHPMDGMLTDEEMDALRAADAAQAQRLYLELMIPHHEG